MLFVLFALWSLVAGAAAGCCCIVPLQGAAALECCHGFFFAPGVSLGSKSSWLTGTRAPRLPPDSEVIGVLTSSIG